MKEKILVIGASGSIGLEIAKRLIEKKKSVSIATRNPEKAKSLNLKGAELVHFDYSDKESFKGAFKNVKKILLVSPPPFLNIHKQVATAIDEAKKENVKLIVNISAMGIEKDKKNPLFLIEQHIIKSGLDYVLLRPSCYMQNFNDLFKNIIKNDNQISAPAGDAKTSFVNVMDVADFAVVSLLNPKLKNKTYTLTGSQALNLHVISFLFSEALKREINYTKISDIEFKRTLIEDGWPKVTIESILQLCNYIKGSENSIITDDLKKVLKREPIKFEQFIKENITTWK